MVTNVTVADTSVGIEFDHLSSAVIDHEITIANVKFEENNAAISHYHSGGSVYVFNSDFAHNEMGFIIEYPYHSNFVINSSYFRQNSYVMEMANPLESCSVFIGLNIFQENTKGITLKDSPSYIYWTLHNNTFIGFSQSAIHLTGQGKIVSNVFQNNTFLTSPIAKIVSSGEEFIFESNVFENNFGYFEMLIMDLTCATVTIRENIITGNRVANHVIDLTNKFSNKLEGNAKFINNKLLHNTPFDKCFLPLSSIVLKGQKGFNISANAFVNPSFRQELYFMIPSYNTTSQIDLSYNFWGTNDTGIIGRRSYHGIKGVVPVKYAPFYGDEMLDAITRHPVHHVIDHYVLPSALQYPYLLKMVKHTR